VQLYAFDVLALDGEDLRNLPFSMRKTNLERLLARRPDGIFVAPVEQGEIGPDLFREALKGCVEALRPPVSGGPVEALDQDQEPPAPGDGSGQRIRGLIQSDETRLSDLEDRFEVRGLQSRWPRIPWLAQNYCS